MNCLQALAVAAAALVASGEPVLQPLIDARAHLERGEGLLHRATACLEARFAESNHYVSDAHVMPDSQIHTIRRLL